MRVQHKIGDRVTVTLPLAGGGTTERDGRVAGHTASGLLHIVVARDVGDPMQMTMRPSEVRKVQSDPRRPEDE